MEKLSVNKERIIELKSLYNHPKRRTRMNKKPIEIAM